MHAITCPWLWLWYDKILACSMFSCLQKHFNLYEMKFVHAADTFFFGSQIPQTQSCLLKSGCQLKDNLSSSQQGLCYNSLQHTICIILNSEYISTNNLPGMVWHLVWYYLLTWLCLLVFHACCTLFHSVFLCLYLYLSSILTHMLRAFFFSIPIWVLCNYCRI